VWLSIFFEQGTKSMGLMGGSLSAAMHVMVCRMSDAHENSPWICHICDFKSATTESRTCSVCYRVTCPAHLQRVSTFNKERSLYELQDVCVSCVIH
jgi:hypothetical protein